MESPAEVPDFLDSLIHRRAIGMAIAMIAAITAIVALAPRATVMVILIVAVVGLGLLSIKHTVNALHRTALAKRFLAERLKEAVTLWDETRQTTGTELTKNRIREWEQKTETDFDKYVDVSHAARFKAAGFRFESLSPSKLETQIQFLTDFLSHLDQR